VIAYNLTMPPLVFHLLSTLSAMLPRACGARECTYTPAFPFRLAPVRAWGDGPELRWWSRRGDPPSLAVRGDSSA
jgi:hypothetical protein